MLFVIFVSILIAQTQGQAKDKENCDNFQANFNLKEIVGSWNVIAVIPSIMYPKNHTLVCYRLDFSETDVGGLRWLVNHTINTNLKALDKVEGPILRQRYHSRQPFDIWSKSVEGVNGCFEQVLSLNYSNENDMTKVNTGNPKMMMQLHLLKSTDGKSTLLFQMLWSKNIAGVIYSKDTDVDIDDLLNVAKLIEKLRGPQREFKMCDIATA